MQALPKVSPEARRQAKAEAALAAAGVPLDFAAVAKVLRQGLAPGLDAKLADRFDRPTAVRAVSTRVAALSAALIALGVRRGGVCIVPALASFATLQGVVAAGLRPWLVDVDPCSWMFDPAHLRERLGEAPPPIEAIVPTCAFGRAPDMNAWAAFQRETGLPIVVDATDGFDVIMDAPVPVVVGLPGGRGVFVASQDADFIARLDAPAFTGDAGLDGWSGQRLRLATAAQRLRMLLLGAPISFQPGWGMSWVSDAWVVRVSPGAAPVVAAKLAEMGYATNPVGPGIVIRDHTPVADRLAKSVLSLPFHADLGITELDELAEAVRKAL
ncbi:DegT/DnrJ/EryC1/StrS family aminotransferase [Caulobacter sp.]|uniref:DegT/DnrJ/EryC1/StrS family aminotransferase n=1 Tax=Caulobacter sp. TaxID=78 RepID=UPI003BAFF95A